MDEKQALRRLQRRDENALTWFIRRYAAYVDTVIYNILADAGTGSDAEEIASDVFLVLWNHADRVRPGKVKAYLSGTARNMARDRLRRAGRELPLEEDVLILADADVERAAELREEAGLIRQAVLNMGQPDREIFLRHYYYGQPLSRIAAEMDMNLSTVKTRLRRGRIRLKDELRKGGYEIEDKDI